MTQALNPISVHAIRPGHMPQTLSPILVHAIRPGHMSQALNPTSIHAFRPGLMSQTLIHIEGGDARRPNNHLRAWRDADADRVH